MSYNGSGTFLINTAGQPVVSGTVISSTAFNALTADLATGLSTAITKDGQTTVTANIPMSTYKFTGLGVGSAATDSANLSQVQSTVTKLLNSVSGADTITATASPTLAAYAAGQMFYFVAAGDNTTSVTLNIDSLGAKAVTRDGATALAAADIKSGEVVVVVYDGTRFQVVSQLNSAGDARFANVSIASSLYVGGVSTFVGNAGFSANVSIASALSVGGVAAITGATTIGGNLTLSGGTANGVLYLNGSKVATSGSALTFDGTTLLTKSATGGKLTLDSTTTGTENTITSLLNNGNLFANINYVAVDHIFKYGSTELARFTSTGNLGIGTASPSNTAGFSRQVQIEGTTAALTLSGTTGTGKYTFGVPGVNAVALWDNTASAYRWYVDSSGNFGIGTTSPSYKLHVAATANDAGLFTSTATTTALRLDNTNANGWGSNLAIYTGGTAAGYFGTIGSLIGNTTQDLAVYANTGNGFRIYTNGNNLRATFDTSGNLGLGVTPSAWGSGWTAFQLSASGAALSGRGSTSEVYLSSNAHFNGSNWIYKLSATAALYDQDGGKHRWSTAASGTAGNAITFTQAMTLDASGRLLVGATSAPGSGEIKQLLARAGSSYLEFQNTTTNTGCTIGTADQNFIIYTNSGVLGSETYTERARITAAGNVVAGGSVALATNATDGFLYVPTCAGTPTGTPTAITGMAPIVVNTTNNKLYFYSGGAWRDAGP